jgi:hypothetical protein
VVFYHALEGGILSGPGGVKPFQLIDLSWLLPVTFGFTGVYLVIGLRGYSIWYSSDVLRQLPHASAKYLRRL